MGTALPTGNRSSAPPSIKLRNLGDYVRFAVVDIKLDRPATEIGTNTPKLKADGTPVTQHILTVLVTDPGQAVRVVGESYEPFEANTLGTIFIESWMKWDPDRDKITAPYKSWGGITDEVGLAVGYVGEWKFIEELTPTRAGNNGRKDRKFRLRADKPEEAEQQQRCEQLRRELSDERTTFSEPAESQQPAYAGASADEF
jgi:hypothetical protein